MKPKAPSLAALSLALLVALVPRAAAAGSDPSTPGALRVTRPGGAVVDMPLRHTRVAIEVSAFVARATVWQVFANPFDEPVEAVYTFPLGNRAAVDDFELTIGDRTIRGEIKRREEARAVYEQARAQGLQAALLEQERSNVFTQSVANLEPGKEITVRLGTVETLRYERGTYGLAFPLVVGPRYVPGGAVSDASRITPPVLAKGLRSGQDVEIAVTIEAGVPVANLNSPSHRILVDDRSARVARVRLASDDSIPNKDFLLRWSVASAQPAVGLLAHREDGDGFFTLLVQPKGEIDAQEAAPKEIVFVVDTSGSMSGVPIEASKRLVAKALREMGRRDTFNLIRFAGDNEVFSSVSVPNDPASIDRAIGWLQRQQGQGGTELLNALRAAFTLPADPNRLRVVVFLTDGYVGDDARILAEIGRVLGAARIYTVGIGSSVNHDLLDRMADLGNGAYVFVRPDERADDALEAFRSWVTRPYLTELAIDWGALPVADCQPSRLRDLGSGQTLTLLGRYLAPAEGDVTVRGKLGGRYWEQRVRVVLPDREARNDALASLWARGRIDELMRPTPDGLPDSVRAEVTALALEYRLMSPFTSFVAVDDSRVANPSGNPRTVHQALPLPDGVSFEGIFGKDGPPGLRAVGDEAEPEDERYDREVGESDRESSAIGYVQSAAPPAPPVRAETVTVVADKRAKFSSEFIDDLPVTGRLYRNELTLSPGTAAGRGDGNPNLAGARERDFKTNVSGVRGADIQERAIGVGVEHGRERLRDAAFRVLADLAADGKLSPSEGRPALAALMAAQRATGAIASDVTTHALATWAIAEASAAAPSDPWLAAARTKAVDHLVALPTGGQDADATRWARLVLGAVRPAAVAALPVPSGEPSKLYARLRQGLAAARSGAGAGPLTGGTPFDRLVASIPRRNLRVVRT